MDDVDHHTAGDIGAHRLLHASTRKWLMVFLIGAAFVAAGIIMIVTKGDFLAWFITLFFAVVAGVATLQLVGAGSQLELNADTFVLTNFGRQTTERWHDCADFNVFRTGHNELVGYDRARDVATHFGEMNRSISGRSAGLPDTFGMNAQDLADLMNAYQQNAVARSWQRHADAVTKFRDIIAQDLRDTRQPANIITEPADMALPEQMPAWPSILAVAKEPSVNGDRRVLICADILSPLSRWITEDAKREQAFDLLSADELQIIDPDDGSVRRIAREDNK